MNNYTIIEAPSRSYLMQAVNRFMDAGWLCVGGVTVVTGQDGSIAYLQSMERLREEETQAH